MEQQVSWNGAECQEFGVIVKTHMHKCVYGGPPPTDHVSESTHRFVVSCVLLGQRVPVSTSHGSHQPSTSWAPGLLKSGMRVHPPFPTRTSRDALIALSCLQWGNVFAPSSTLRGRLTADVRAPYTPSRHSPRFYEQLGTMAMVPAQSVVSVPRDLVERQRDNHGHSGGDDFLTQLCAEPCAASWHVKWRGSAST